MAVALILGIFELTAVLVPPDGVVPEGPAPADEMSPDPAFPCVRDGRRGCPECCAPGWSPRLSPKAPVWSVPAAFPCCSATGLRRVRGAWREELTDAWETDRPSWAESRDAPSDPLDVVRWPPYLMRRGFSYL